MIVNETEEVGIFEVETDNLEVNVDVKLELIDKDVDAEGVNRLDNENRAVTELVEDVQRD